MANGKIKMYSEEKGFGFIRPDDGSVDVFFHESALREGDDVTIVSVMKGVYDASSLPFGPVTAMSQYQRLRVASKPTGWPATSTATVDSSMLSEPLASWAVLSGKQDGAGWPGSEIAVLCTGSKPHSVTYGAIEVGGSTGELLC